MDYGDIVSCGHGRWSILFRGCFIFDEMIYSILDDVVFYLRMLLRWQSSYHTYDMTAGKETFQR